MEENPVMVVAALIEREGALLICQRSSDDRHALKWEFPGGKVEPGEAAAAALARELHEELSIRARIGPEVTRYRYHYPGRHPLLLMFFRVLAFEGEPQNNVFADIRWARPADLPRYDFLDGDVKFVRALARGELITEWF